VPLPVEERLPAHLALALGQWPPRAELDVVGSARRTSPGWDGEVRPVLGVTTPTGTVLSVPPSLVTEVGALGPAWRAPAFAAGLNDLLGHGGGRRCVLDGTGLYRWSTAPADLPDTGEWVERDDPRVPPWLRPFNGGVLCAWDDDGAYVAGVGLKHHDEHGEEIAVGTEPAARGKGLARLLVATAARAVLRRGAVPTYLHAADNVASARVATAAGFPDRGWHVVGLFTQPLT